MGTFHEKIPKLYTFSENRQHNGCIGLGRNICHNLYLPAKFNQLRYSALDDITCSQNIVANGMSRTDIMPVACTSNNC